MIQVTASHLLIVQLVFEDHILEEGPGYFSDCLYPGMVYCIPVCSRLECWSMSHAQYF